LDQPSPVRPQRLLKRTCRNLESIRKPMQRAPCARAPGLSRSHRLCRHTGDARARLPEGAPQQPHPAPPWRRFCHAHWLPTRPPPTVPRVPRSTRAAWSPTCRDQLDFARLPATQRGRHALAANGLPLPADATPSTIVTQQYLKHLLPNTGLAPGLNAGMQKFEKEDPFLVGLPAAVKNQCCRSSCLPPSHGMG